MKTLRTERLVLRQWQESDLDAWVGLNEDPEVTEYLIGRSAAESARLMQRFAESADEHGYGFVAIEAAGECVGMCGLADVRFDAPFAPTIEIGWRLAREHWGRGYATEAAREWLRFAFVELERPEVVSFTATDNHKSRAVMQRLGMHHDQAGDFAHPNLAADHRLSQHVLYQISVTEWHRMP